MARLLRQKSKVLVAFGACATAGGIPALANLTTPEAIFQAAFLDNPTTPNPEGVLPRPQAQVPEGELHIPSFYNTVKSLEQVVDVDYRIPGCPPEPPQIWAVLEAVTRLCWAAPACLQKALSWEPATWRFATNVRWKSTKNSSSASTDPMRSRPNRENACWNRAWFVWVPPRGAAAALSAHRSAWAAGAVTAGWIT